MNTRPGALLCGVLIALSLTGHHAAAADRPRNVLMIVSDDLNNDLGCYGWKSALTPNLDRLAASGVRFDRAYCQFPLCNPSRASFMTGRRPDTTGVYDNARHLRQNLPLVETLPQLFQRYGYFTARVGKIYHYGVPAQIGTDGLDDVASWEQRFNPYGRDKTDEDQVIAYTGGGGRLGAAISFLAADGTDEEQTDGMTATRIIALMEKHRDRPFFLACGFFRPHVPCVAPKPWFAKHPISGLSLPDEPADHLASVPEIALYVKPPNYGLSDDKMIEFLQGYRASVSFMDAQVGRLMDALKRLGLEDDTVVVFFSDHGYLLGQHGQWQKQSLFEQSARVPLIVSAPGLPAAGKVSPRTVELIDVYPTIADLCGLTPRGTEGVSLKPLLENPDAAWSRPAYTVVTRLRNQNGQSQRLFGRSVRTERWRYAEWDEGRQGSQLYDHQRDPGEFRNLAEDPASTEVVAEMRALLHRQM